ncbi:uncharacterized protein JCM6883_007252 [Sporobolomyces salmoneus]|uniref:uncharacterized protein n=1 Tax=Sporobolomyces salmoneus TaxID=183962 RepID=UPI0031744B64
MDGEAIYSALLDHASTRLFSSSSPSAPLLPTPASLAVVLGDDRSERIYQALVSAASSASPASLHDSTFPAPLPTTSSGSDSLSNSLPDKLSSLASSSHASKTSSPSMDYPGFLTSRFTSLPSAASILVGVYLILVSIACLIAGARSLYFERDLGRTYGSNEKKGWLRGGVGGIFFGSTGLGLISALLTMLVVSRQKETSLGAWATLSILLLCSIPGAIAGGRWERVSKSSVAFVGSVSFSLLLIVSFHVSSTLTRLILSAVFLVISLVAAHLRFSERFALPILSALSGSFLLVLGIDLFLHLGFIDALGLLIQSSGVGSGGGEATEGIVVEWSSSGGKGLIAGWWILSILSAAWQTWWGLGIEGQELWNDYLSRYIPPSDPLGTHQPPPTIKERLTALFSNRKSSSKNRHTKFSRRPGARRTTPWDDIDAEEEDEDEFDFEKGFGLEERLSSSKRERRGEDSDVWDSEVDTLASRSTPRRPRNVRSGSSKPAQYGAGSPNEEEEDEREEGGGGRIWSAAGLEEIDSKSTRSFGALSGSTAVTKVDSRGGGNEEILEKAHRHRRGGGKEGEGREEEAEENHLSTNFDREEKEATAATPTPTTSKKRGSLFRLERIFGNNSTSPSSTPGSNNLTPASSFSPTSASATNNNSVPATPSLITAIQRVGEAQRQARGNSTSRPPAPHEETSPTSTRGRSGRASMDEFWKSVVDKAATPASKS